MADYDEVQTTQSLSDERTVCAAVHPGLLGGCSDSDWMDDGMGIFADQCSAKTIMNAFNHYFMSSPQAKHTQIFPSQRNIIFFSTLICFQLGKLFF